MGKRTWLDQLLTLTYLPAISALKDTEAGREEARRLGVALRQDWEVRGFTTLARQQGLMDQTRLTLKERLGADHFSLGFIKFERDEYFELNQAKQVRARDRQLHQQYLQNPDEIVATAVRLLESLEWAEVAAGVAVLTGRRLNEVLRTAEFSIKSQWVVTFKGALKRREEVNALVFDIPTLTTAKKVVAATQRLREMTPLGADESLVGKASERYFADLVPVPSGKENLYSHLWRSVYGCIATFWYCPPHVDDLLFKAHILGHFETLAADELGNGTLLRRRLETFSSERHYRLYEVADEVVAYYKGQRKGIKLGLAGVEPLEVFEAGMPEQQRPQLKRKRSTFRIWQEDHDALVALLANFEGNSQPEKVHAWLQWSHDQWLTGSQPQQPETKRALPPSLEAPAETTPIQSEKTGPTQPPPSQPSAPAPLDGAQTDSQSVAVLTSQIADLVAVMREFVAVQMDTSPMPRLEAPPHSTRRPRRESQAGVQTPPPADGQPARATPGRPPGEDDALVNRALSAILAFNNTEGRTHDQRWFVTANLLKKFTPKGNQRAAERVLAARNDEVQKHHAQHQLQPDHNQRHRKHNPLEIIRLEP